MIKNIFLKCFFIPKRKQWKKDIMFWGMHFTSVISLYVLHQATEHFSSYKNLRSNF